MGWVVPLPSNSGNEGLGWDSLLNMKQSWWSLLLGRGTTQYMGLYGFIWVYRDLYGFIGILWGNRGK